MSDSILTTDSGAAVPGDDPLANYPAFFLMHNVVQNYAWGSPTSLTQLFGIENPEGQPQAELWMGAHINGCSRVSLQGEWLPLSALIAQDVSAFLGPRVATQFAELPFLFKILAAEQALSIQVHPNKQQAEQGFAAEERQQIALSDGKRNYKDPNHKPELVYALTEYQAMNGFRPLCDILHDFSTLAITAISPLLDELIAAPTPDGLATFFSGLLRLEGDQKQAALTALLEQSRVAERLPFSLITGLARQYPGDIGLFAPLLLNVITLQPGEAMYLDAQTPHAYLKGTGLEIMANSDNVLRAGLTPKHVDVAQLVACTRFCETPYDRLLLAPEEHEQTWQYPVPVDDFKFAIIAQPSRQRIAVESAEILLPLDSDLLLTHDNGDNCVVIRGQSIFIPAYARHYTLDCPGRVARAYC